MAKIIYFPTSEVRAYSCVKETLDKLSVGLDEQSKSNVINDVVRFTNLLLSVNSINVEIELDYLETFSETQLAAINKGIKQTFENVGKNGAVLLVELMKLRVDKALCELHHF